MGFNIESVKHGMWKSPEYQAWSDMKRRCLNPKYPSYHRYGGRGIKYYPSWSNFSTFYKDVGPRPSSLHSLDRIDNDGNYEPGNVKWSTVDEQNRNHSRAIRYEWQGEKLTIPQIAKIHGFVTDTLRKRLKILGSLEKALDWNPSSGRPRIPR